MTDYRIGQAHGYPLQVPAPEGVDEALAAVMARHRAEIDEALAPFDLRAEDLIDPTWMVIVRLHDVEPYDEAESVAIAPGDILLASVTHGEVDGEQAPDVDARDWRPTDIEGD